VSELIPFVVAFVCCEAAVVARTLFITISCGIRSERCDVAATLGQVNGWQIYFQRHLSKPLTDEAHQIVKWRQQAAADCFIQVGSVGLRATANVGKAFTVGGIGDDNEARLAA
jgi:hypothetical protein